MPPQVVEETTAELPEISGEDVVIETEPVPEMEAVEIVPDSEFDVDLTRLSATMVYAEVYNMMVNPQDYLGKSVKMEGIYAEFLDETTDTLYCAIIIQDATACCAQGVEFILTDDYAYPEDYPVQGEIAMVTGTFATYTPEGAPDLEFVHLLDGELVS